MADSQQQLESVFLVRIASTGEEREFRTVCWQTGKQRSWPAILHEVGEPFEVISITTDGQTLRHESGDPLMDPSQLIPPKATN
jgi:hypothetical protein